MKLDDQFIPLAKVIADHGVARSTLILELAAGRIRGGQRFGRWVVDRRDLAKVKALKTRLASEREFAVTAG